MPDPILIQSLGSLCPIPIIELSKNMRNFRENNLFLLESDDLATWADLQAWARLTKNHVERIDQNTFAIRRAVAEARTPT